MIDAVPLPAAAAAETARPEASPARSEPVLERNAEAESEPSTARTLELRAGYAGPTRQTSPEERAGAAEVDIATWRAEAQTSETRVPEPRPAAVLVRRDPVTAEPISVASKAGPYWAPDDPGSPEDFAETAEGGRR